MSLSSTTSETGLSTFGSLASQANLTYSLENTQSITAFLPSNAAFAAAGNSTTSTSTLISNHIVSGLSGYLPDLTDGMNLTTKTGGALTVSVRSGIWYINDAKITQANLIMENGVAHIIDQVCPLFRYHVTNTEYLHDANVLFPGPHANHSHSRHFVGEPGCGSWAVCSPAWASGLAGSVVLDLPAGGVTWGKVYFRGWGGVPVILTPT